VGEKLYYYFSSRRETKQMTSLRGKPVKLLVVLALTAVLCLAFAAAASAAPAVTVNADGQTYTCSMKDDVSFTFDITGLNSVAACFTDPNQKATITIDFPAGFDLTPATGLTVPLKVYINTDGWYYAQPTPVIDAVYGTATITVPILPISNPNTKYVNRIIVGDENQDLKVDVDCFNDGDQNIDVKLKTKCEAAINMVGSIYVYDVPWTIGIDSITPSPILACDTITVKGRVYDCKGADWACKDVVVTLGENSVTVVTDGFGAFEATLPTPATAGNYTVYATAATAQCGITASTYQDITVIAKPPAKLQWYKFIDEAWEALCDETQVKKECTLLRIELRDNCPAENKCNGGNVAVAGAGGVKVDLTAIVKGSSPPDVGAHFYETDVNCANDTNQIGTITIPAGASYIDVWMKPIVNGFVVVEGRSAGLTPDSFDAHVYTDGMVTLKLTTKVADENNNPRAGWAMQAAAWLDTTWCNNCANKDFNVMVELRNVSPNLTATWGNALTLDYGVTGPNGSGASYSHSQYKDPDNDCKSHFYIYANPVGDVDCKFSGSLEVRVKVTCNATGITYASPWKTISYTTPVELARELRYDSWQTLSTPKWLVGAGNLSSVLGGTNYKIAYTYFNGKWYQVTDANRLTPLYCYYVKMKQGPTPDADICTANYIYKRTTSPSGIIPPTRPLVAGWNAVGVAEPICHTDEYGDFECGDCYYQPEEVYRWLGSLCTLCKKVVNPGNELGKNLLGNLADFSNLTVSAGTEEAWDDDPDNHDVYNGDNYWLWLDGPGTIVAETAQDLPTDEPYNVI